MPSIIEEIIADQDPRAQCRLCTWITSRPASEQKEWDEALNTRIGPRFRFTHTSVYRALNKHGATVGKGTVENHRNAGHRAEAS